MMREMPEMLLAFALLAVWPAFGQQREGVYVAALSADSNCHNVSSRLNAEEKAELLRAHNELRSQVTRGQLPGLKPAANMFALRWDDELADLAEEHARQCGAARENDHEKRTGLLGTLGRNIGWEASSDPFADHLDLPHIKVWKSEHKDVEDDVISSYRNTESGIGQFTQMIWANTQTVGCGVATYTRKDNVGRYPYQRSLTCYYSPGGNVRGLPVYEEGAACSRCPPGSACDKLSGLCRIDGMKVPEHDQAMLTEDEWNWRPIALAIMLVIWLCI
ncbi:scoloptoxin SSD976-like [Amblyomma americanum]